MTLREQIELELDDAIPEAFMEDINKLYPELTLNSIPSVEQSDKISDILIEYAK